MAKARPTGRSWQRRPSSSHHWCWLSSWRNGASSKALRSADSKADQRGREETMKKYLKACAAGVAALAMLATGTAVAQTKTTINVQYPLGFIFDKVFTQLKSDFEA